MRVKMIDVVYVLGKLESIAKKWIFSKDQDSMILIFTVLEFAHLDVSKFIETYPVYFFMTRLQLTRPVPPLQP